MSEFEDKLDRLASAGLSRRQSGVAGFPVKFSSCHSQLSEKCLSVDSAESSGSEEGKTFYRVLVMGAARVGKTAIISQFLYDKFESEYQATVEEMYRGNFDVGNTKLCLNIEDTSGTFAYDFPAMVEVSLFAADVVLLVFSVEDCDSFEQVVLLKEKVRKSRGPAMPVVVVGNKIDLERKVDKAETEALVMCDWENGYVECSAKVKKDVEKVFQELLHQVKIEFCSTVRQSRSPSSLTLKRRQSVPAVPSFNRGLERGKGGATQSNRRRSITDFLGDELCKMC